MRGTRAPMHEVLEELRQTACLLAGCHELTVVEGEDRTGWSYNSTTKVITMDSTRLRTESLDFNRGLLLHEGAHAAITRLRPMIHGDLYARPEIFSIINALEDCRLESWLIERFPGSKPWIKEYNDKLIRSSFKGSVDQSGAEFPAILAIPWMIVSTWWHGKKALELPPEWSAIRDEIWPTVDAISRLYPRAIIPTHIVRTRYEQLGLPIRFLGDDSEQEPDVWEKETQICQAEMWNLFENSIRPVLCRILPDSKKPRHREWYRQWLTVWMGNHSGPIRNASALSGQQGPNTGGSGTKSSNSIPWKANLPNYELMRSKSASVIERLSDEILRRLQPEVFRQWTGPHASGSKLCLFSVVRAEGDPSRKEQVWRRQTHYTRPDPLIVMLVDHSGSMSGQRMQVTSEAAVILSETCARCGIGLSVFAFESQCTPVIDWRQPIDDTARSILGGLADAAEGGTDLESALKDMLHHFAQSPFSNRYLFILSDGNVDEVDKVRAVVRQLEHEGIQVRGLGLGPETRNLKEVIPNSEVEIGTLQQVPKAIIQLLLNTVPSREPSRI